MRVLPLWFPLEFFIDYNKTILGGPNQTSPEIAGKSTLLFFVSHQSHFITQVRQLSLRYNQQTVRSSRTPRADQRSHVECAVGINVMRVDARKAIYFKVRQKIPGLIRVFKL